MNISPVSNVKCNKSTTKSSFKNNSTPNFKHPNLNAADQSLALLGSLGLAFSLGTISAGFTSCLTEGKKMPALVGLGVGLITMISSLHARFYDSKGNNKN